MLNLYYYEDASKRLYVLNDGITYSAAHSLDNALHKYYHNDRYSNNKPYGRIKLMYRQDRCIYTDRDLTFEVPYLTTLSPFASTYSLVKQLHPELFI